MTATDMSHMNYLSTVAMDDVMVLNEKEKTYRGSWKAAGGRSAWFMARRNMDRLIEMMKKPETPDNFNLTNVDDTLRAMSRMTPSPRRGEWCVEPPGTPEATHEMLQYLRDSYVAENVFAKIREKPSGDDGTVLACMRDLRRYLLLIEAEMVARGVVSTEHGKHREAPEGPKGPSMREERRVPRYEEKAEYHKDDDAAQHASMFPWQRHELPGDFLTRTFYKHVAHKLWRLEPFVDSEKIPREIAHCYDLSVNMHTWILRMGNLPDELRDAYPRLQLELNAKEFDDNPNPYMYGFDPSDGKYKLREVYIQTGWGREVG